MQTCYREGLCKEGVERHHRHQNFIPSQPIIFDIPPASPVLPPPACTPPLERNQSGGYATTFRTAFASLPPNRLTRTYDQGSQEVISQLTSDDVVEVRICAGAIRAFLRQVSNFSNASSISFLPTSSLRNSSV